MPQCVALLPALRLHVSPAVTQLCTQSIVCSINGAMMCTHSWPSLGCLHEGDAGVALPGLQGNVAMPLTASDESNGSGD